MTQRASYRVKPVRKRKANIVYQHTCMESRKMTPRGLSAGQQGRRRHREQTCGRGVVEGGVNSDSSIETHALSYVK